MMTQQLKIRDYQIVTNKGLIDACAQFIYKNRMVSFSTWGLSQGACQTEVYVYGKDAVGDDYNVKLKNDLHTVEDAIKYIDSIAAVTSPV